VQVRDGIPYIAYYNDAGLNLARWNYTGWLIDTIDRRTASHNRGPSLVFDRAGNPRVAFYCGTPWYAYADGEAWFVEQIDSDSAGDYISLWLDTAGRPSVAYNRYVGILGSRLKFAGRDSLSWHPELVDSAGGWDCVLRFDTAGTPCIAHCDFESGDALYYTHRVGGGWDKDTVLAAGASQSCLVLDSLGDPHISYYWASSGNYDLRYCDRLGGTWRFDVVDPGHQTNKHGWDNCIARASDGSYHISYHAHNEQQLRYARGSYGSWQVAVLDTTVGDYYLFSSIALDSLDRAYIAYCNDNQNGALYLASQSDLTGLEEPPKADEGRPMLCIGPNPCQGALSLRLETNRQRQAANARLLIHDAAGRAVRKLELEICTEAQVDLRALPAGIYFVSVYAGECATRQRIVKLK
jgi:hypothetical protein